jgi:arylformamidase
LIDISMPLKNGMVRWPGDPEVDIGLLASIEKGSVCNVTRMAMSAHTGTHMDAPRHFLEHGITMEQMPLEATVGRCRVVAIEDREAIRRAELLACDPQPGERLLFKTINSARCYQTDDFYDDFVYLSNDGARLLAERQVRTIGVDYISIGGFHKDLVRTHLTVLGAGIWVIEGLNLAAVNPGVYELICLPLLIPGADGAPARALLRDITQRAD